MDDKTKQQIAEAFNKMIDEQPFNMIIYRLFFEESHGVYRKASVRAIDIPEDLEQRNDCINYFINKHYSYFRDFVHSGGFELIEPVNMEICYDPNEMIATLKICWS